MFTIITGKDNGTLRAAAALTDKKYRDESGAFLISGRKLCFEALDAAAVISEVFATDAFTNAYPAVIDRLQAECKEASFYKISESLLSKLTDEKSPEGIVCKCRRLDKTEKTDKIYDKLPKSFVLICDRLSDPGNLGSVLRSARAFAANAVILSSGCADLYSQKVLRGAMGAVFTANIKDGCDTSSEIARLKRAGYTVYAAALHRNAVSLADVDFNGRVAVVIGNEGTGLSNEITALCDAALLIPMEPDCESLNAATAASLIMWESYRRQKLTKG